MHDSHQIEVGRVTTHEVEARIDRDEPIVFIDARSEEEWAESNLKLPGAVRVEADRVREYLHEIPRGRGVVPAAPLRAALRAINHSLGQGLPPADLPVFRSRSFCPELQRAPVILDLLRVTPAWLLAESLLGEGRVEAVRSGQIALAFPQTEPPEAPYPHLDGLHTPTNGVPAGEVRSFTLLVGVILSDVTGPGAGNLTVWPGSHRRYESYFRDNGPKSLLGGMPPIALPDPVEVTGSVGDVVLCHYHLAHPVRAHPAP